MKDWRISINYITHLAGSRGHGHGKEEAETSVVISGGGYELGRGGGGSGKTIIRPIAATCPWSNSYICRQAGAAISAKPARQNTFQIGAIDFKTKELEWKERMEKQKAKSQQWHCTLHMINQRKAIDG